MAWQSAGLLLRRPAAGDDLQEALECFVTAHGSRYIFDGAQYSELWDALLDTRFLSDEWDTLPLDQQLAVVQCLRLLTRDTRYQRSLVLERPGAAAVAGVLHALTQHHLASALAPFQLEITTEVATIVKRLCTTPELAQAIVDAGVGGSLGHLLTTSSATLLTAVLLSLLGLAAACPDALVGAVSVARLSAVLAYRHDVQNQRLAGKLTAFLLESPGARQELLTDGSGLQHVLTAFATPDSEVSHYALRSLNRLLEDEMAQPALLDAHTVPLVCARLGNLAERASSAPSTAPSDVGATHLLYLCTAVDAIAQSDRGCLILRRHNGVFLLGHVVLGAIRLAPDCTPAARKAAQRRAAIAVHALRCLYSVAKIRGPIKRLIPPEVMEAFVGVKLAEAGVMECGTIAAQLGALLPDAVTDMAAALNDVDLRKPAVVQQVGAHSLLELLGEGGYGCVYRVRRASGGAQLALKQLPLSGGARDRPASEVDILSTLRHPRIVGFRGSFSASGSLCILMELVEGQSLLDHIRSARDRGRHLPEAEVWDVAVALILALNYLHNTAGVVHRDVSPSNIMLGRDQGLTRAKLADFGLAARTTGAGSEAVRSSVVGTMPYAAPELITQEAFSVKADVWSLGCVLYHMMMLEAPFDGNNPLAVASKIVEGQQASLSLAKGRYSEQLRGFVEGLMTVDPESRPTISQVACMPAVAQRLMVELDRSHAEIEAHHLEGPAPMAGM